MITNVTITWSVVCVTSINVWRKEFHCIHLARIGNVHIAMFTYLHMYVSVHMEQSIQEWTN